MERYLNLLWCAIVVVTVVVWRMCWAPRRQRGSQHAVFQGIALVCAFVFLFFAVSLTDDLHSDLLLVDDGARRHTIALTCGDHSSHDGVPAQHAGVAVLPTRGAPIPFGNFQKALPLPEARVSFLAKDLAVNRSPPKPAL